MASKKQSSRSKTEIIKTTQAKFETRDPTIAPNEPDDLPESPEINRDLSRYQDGCPECHEKSLVTELKIRSWRQCRCRECGWRGEMED